MSTFHLIVFGGLVGVFAVSSIAEGIMASRTAALDPHTRERIFQREASAAILWRIAHFVALVLVLAGVLRTWGIVNVTNYPYSAVAIGLAIFCASSVLRSWFASRAYHAEAPDTPASRGAFSAAVMVSIAEIALGGGVCWYVFSHRTPPGGAKTNPPAATAKNPTAVPAAKGMQPAQWIGEAEALQLLPGKDAAYLQALARRADVRSRDAGGEARYHRDDIVKMKLAGLPGAEEIIEVGKELPARAAPVPPPETKAKEGEAVTE